MNIVSAICVALIIGMAALQFNHGNHRKKISNQMMELVKAKKYNELYKMENQPEVVRYIPEFNRYYLCMNGALLENNVKKINEYFDKLAELKLNSQQKKIVFMRGLQYFVASHDTKRCKVCYDNLITLDMDDNSKQYLDNINAIIINKETNRLEELLTKVNTNDDNEKFIDEYLVAEIYRNIGDIEKSSTYGNLAKQHLDLYIKETSNVA